MDFGSAPSTALPAAAAEVSPPARRDGLLSFVASRLGSARIRVLFVTSMWPDAVRPHYGVFIRSQAGSLEHAGVAVDVLTIRGYRSMRAYAMTPRAVLRLARDRAYDVIHVHTGHAAVVSVWGIRQPIVLSFVGADVLGQPRERGLTVKSRLEVAVFRQLARRAATTVTKSREMERALPASTRIRNHVIPNGVDVETFTPAPKEQARRSLGWTQDEKVALFLGDPADPRKNVALARAAVALARESLPTLRLHTAWGTRPEDVPRLMSAADCLVFSSRSEGSPNVVKEAMAAALPIVATPVGDIAERLAGVKGCFVVAPEPAALSAALLRAVELDRAPDARAAVLDLSLPKVAARMIEVYESVINGPV